MAWTYGFFDSVNGDRVYNAEQMSRIFEGLITNGVYESVGNRLAVEPNEGMTIQINTGRGWFSHHWVNNDSEILQELEAADVLLKRYCAVCIRVDDSDSVRTAVPHFKYSEFATNPVKPTMERSETVNEYCLAYVLINAGATAITAADIEDTRGDTDLCGWVTGLIEQVDTTTLWNQYKADWERFMAEKETDSDSWQEQEQDDFETWRLQQQTDFLAWYSNLQTSLDDDVAATLTSKVSTLESDVSGLKTDVAALQGQTVRAGGTIIGLDWVSEDDGSYSQTIAIPGVTADNCVIVAPAVDVRETFVNMGVSPVEQGEDFITFKCVDPADIDIPLEILIFNV